MKDTRTILFYTGTKTIGRTFYRNADWGNVCFMLFYASKVNPTKAKTLLRLIFSEGTYQSTYNLPYTYTGDGQFITHTFNVQLLQEAINFLQNEVFPALMLEAQTYYDIITQKYGGSKMMDDRITSGEEQVTDMIGCIDEYYHDDTEMLAHFCIGIKDFFQAVLNSGTDYETELS
jgi:hypothetical protein